MTKEIELPEPATKAGDEPVNKTSLLRTLISLALFIALDYWMFRSWFAVLSLVTVIAIHEAGHFIAMKFFGYQSVNMTFIPFVGAYVSGQATNLSRKVKLIVLLSGPLPGIVIGCLLLCLHQHNHAGIYMQLAIPFLLLNVFNLLPVFPLDGGQFFQTLFFTGSRVLQLFFLYASMAVLVYLFVKLNYSWPLLFIALLIFYRIWGIHLTNRIRDRLDELGIDYACSYDDLTDDEYWQIRNVIISQRTSLRRRYSAEVQADDEQEIIRCIEKVLVPAYNEDLSLKNKVVFTILWLAAFALPVLLWWYYNGQH